MSPHQGANPFMRQARDRPNGDDPYARDRLSPGCLVFFQGAGDVTRLPSKNILLELVKDDDLFRKFVPVEFPCGEAGKLNMHLPGRLPGEIQCVIFCLDFIAARSCAPRHVVMGMSKIGLQGGIVNT